MATELANALELNATRFLENDQPLSAVPLTAMLREVKPNSTKCALLHAKTLFALCDYDLALRTAKEVMRDDDNLDALLIAMKSAYELRDLKSCVSYAERLKENLKTSVIALCYLGRCAELNGDITRAVQYYRAALDQDPFCGEPVNALIERRLLSVTKVREVLDSLKLPPSAEALRASYKARLPGEKNSSEYEKYIPRSTLQLQAARIAYENNDLQRALALTTELLKLSPFNRECVCLHLSILVDMKATSKLFDIAHFLCNSKTHAELAVYAVGCFQYSLANHERAGRYFSKATELDSSFAEAWIAYGHCYAKLEEGEQALNVYIRAMNIFPGLPCCRMFVGMQYSRTHQWMLASQFLEDARQLMPRDPLVLNEIGVVLARTKRIDEALKVLNAAYRGLANPENPSEHQDCIIFNLATVYRKLRRYKEAISFYTLYMKCRPNASHGHCALAFTYHLMRNMEGAISHYHIALSIKTDSFCRDMLDRALAEFGGNTSSFANRIRGVFLSQSPDTVSFSNISKTFESEPFTLGNTEPSPMGLGRSRLYPV
ncbi:putative Tetratricopeptide repeat [Trypanosoma vivax]|uniref:Putative CDC16 n=1 Tax=Trypanosoma vivax (strain Y486) TaxID=1055687 RepID=G0TWN5_TRYVY|nr:putative Tetratricopeptide repeat [Trypanosoma vivax]CCC48373.1 putative CDC16 [Trypanosoma vivax Y486]